MKKTTIIIALTLLTFSSFSQTKQAPPKAVADTTPTYYFKVSDLNQVINNINAEAYQIGWKNISLAQIFSALIVYLEERKQVKMN